MLGLTPGEASELHQEKFRELIESVNNYLRQTNLPISIYVGRWSEYEQKIISQHYKNLGWKSKIKFYYWSFT